MHRKKRIEKNKIHVSKKVDFDSLPGIEVDEEAESTLKLIRKLDLQKDILKKLIDPLQFQADNTG